MADQCRIELSKAPGTRSAHGWLWSQQNPPLAVDEYRPGKWMLFPTCAEAPADWQKVAGAALDGVIWGAKVSPDAARACHLICVYTADFTNASEVEATAQRLA